MKCPKRRGTMYDVVIIGSGPAGITAGIYAKRAGLQCLVVEKSGKIGRAHV